MKAYSIDLRERVVAAVEAGMSKAAAARLFQISYATVKRFCHQKQTSGSLEPKKAPGLTPRILPQEYEALAQQLRQDPDATLQQQAACWSAGHHQTVSATTISRTLKRMKWSRKKKPNGQ